MSSTPNAAAANLRRYWWLFLVVLLALDVMLPLLWRISYWGEPGLRGLLRWLPFAVHLLPRLLLMGWLWSSLQEGGRIQILLTVQAAIPLLALAINQLLLPLLTAQNIPGAARLFPLVFLLTLAAELAALGTAIWLREQEGEEGQLGVTASAGLAVLGQGWVAVGLLPLLAKLMKDPLLVELSHADEDAERGAFRASRTGFLLAFGIPFLVWLGSRNYPGQGRHLWLLIPALVIGAATWNRFGASLGASGKPWRVLTWVLLGVWPVLALALLFVLLTFSGHWH